MKRNLFAMLAVSAVILASCSKEKSGGNLSYQVSSASYTAPFVSASGGVSTMGSAAVTWTSGSANISEIDFEAKKEDLKIEYEFKKLVNVDLFKTSPILGSLTVPDGTYSEVELKLELKKVTGGAAPLTLKGEYEDANGVKTPVEFSLNEDVEIKVEAENVTINGDDHIAMINLQLNKLLAGLTEADLKNAVKTGGKIEISNGSNSGLYSKIKINLDIAGDCDFKK